MAWYLIEVTFDEPPDEDCAKEIRGALQHDRWFRDHTVVGGCRMLTDEETASLNR